MVAARERVLGTEHPDTISAQSNLAVTLHAMGEFEEARSLEQWVVAARERVLGTDHPDTITARNNLATTLYAMGEYTAARELLESALVLEKICNT